MADPAGVLTVLAADDEPGIRTGIARALRDLRVTAGAEGAEWSLRVEEAADGAATLERLERGGVDVLLLDHGMPLATGMDVLAALHGRDDAPLTVMVTAYGTLEMAVQATKEGAHDFLAKPFTPAELRATVAKAVRHLAAAREARRLAAEKRRVRFEFLSVLAHELKAPLGAVEGYLRLLQDGVLADDPEGAARAVERSLARLGGMRKLIFDLLDLTRIESGQKARELQDVDLAVLAAEALDTVRPAADARGLRLDLGIEGDVILRADPGEQRIVLNNLLTNAVKYNRDGGEVRVRLEGGADAVRLRVADTGIGMNEEEVGRLFGEFVRIRNERTRGIEGSGLGLSIVRRLARLHGGDVAVASRPDAGSEFTVTLPREVPA
ncbi:MAG TPA: ATP-binding protein [Candidatus Krumholzibacteria bacterium]|nr:ATP-binding protein [Candidatus Krumholzibacteria bacterium]HRX52448.1 ATP-binding protein [Candidatus Krumholzibacteria bacterium]